MVSRDKLPAPFDYLLTQPLMTKAIKNYYQCTPWIQKIYAVKNKHNNTYHRAIIMYVDKKVETNSKPSKFGVELAFITMNFNALSRQIIHDVLNTNVPFGQLLTHYHVKIFTTERTYFSVKCNLELASLIHCNRNSTIYGRTNTIISTDNHQWLAHVIEILSGFLNHAEKNDEKNA